MRNSPFRDVAIVGIANTVQARSLPEHDSKSIAMQAALAALADAGLTPLDVDGITGPFGGDFAYEARIGPVWRSASWGVLGVLESAAAISTGLASTVLVFDGGAGHYVDRESTAPWTRPSNEFVAPFGMFTAAEFALIARRHMYQYGTTEESLATVAATIRNNGHVNPDALYFGRGPFTPDDVLASRMIADPFHLLDCATTSEGGSAVVLTRVERAVDLPNPLVHVLGGGSDRFGTPYAHAPSFDFGGRRRPDLVDGWVGRRAAESCWRTSGLKPGDVDVCEFYDPFSFEIVRQFEAFGFCEEGEGGDFVMDGRIGPRGQYPVTTDGGTMSYGHSGTAQILQRVTRGVEQLRGTCKSRQVTDARVALCSAGGAGALFNEVIMLGADAL